MPPQQAVRGLDPETIWVRSLQLDKHTNHERPLKSPLSQLRGLLIEPQPLPDTNTSPTEWKHRAKEPSRKYIIMTGTVTRPNTLHPPLSYTNRRDTPHLLPPLQQRLVITLMSTQVICLKSRYHHQNHLPLNTQLPLLARREHLQRHPIPLTSGEKSFTARRGPPDLRPQCLYHPPTLPPLYSRQATPLPPEGSLSRLVEAATCCISQTTSRAATRETACLRSIQNPWTLSVRTTARVSLPPATGNPIITDNTLTKRNPSRRTSTPCTREVLTERHFTGPAPQKGEAELLIDRHLWPPESTISRANRHSRRTGSRTDTMRGRHLTSTCLQLIAGIDSLQQRHPRQTSTLWASLPTTGTWKVHLKRQTSN